jgi:hypothetical protein
MSYYKAQRVSKQKQQELVLELKKMSLDPIYFIEKMWNLTPCPREKPFIIGKHITWQQVEVLEAVTKALKDQAPRRISIRSGHGIGKSATLAWLIIWYLLMHNEAQIACTAPTGTQMHDVLWKECNKWINALPEAWKAKFSTTSDYIRIVDSPETWFARAATARKEAPEALAGIHGKWVMYVVDEASGVPEEIYNTAEGALTEKNILFIMASNPTRTRGYFFDSHNSDRRNWQTFQYSSLDSPRVDDSYVHRIADKHGSDSDEYRVRVLGEFPNMEVMDDKGWIPLLAKEELHFTQNAEFSPSTTHNLRLGIDPSGAGKDNTTWIIRDNFKAQVVAYEPISTEKSIAEKTLTIMAKYNIAPNNVFIDNFGKGANIAKELALSHVRANTYPVNVGDKCEDDDDKEKFINLRAYSFWNIKQWLRQGGELVNHHGWDELLNIFFRQETSGKIKIMGKQEMRKEGIKSPNFADALMLTFVKPMYSGNYLKSKRIKEERENYIPRNKYTGY